MLLLALDSIIVVIFSVIGPENLNNMSMKFIMTSDLDGLGIQLREGGCS